MPVAYTPSPPAPPPSPNLVIVIITIVERLSAGPNLSTWHHACSAKD